MQKVLVICGPTATGKTALATFLAKVVQGELISADSRQVYRGMDLTTGKDRTDVPIWLYDVVDPDGSFSVSQWVRLAKDAVADIAARGKLPIVVGGTGLYIKALLQPLETIDIPPNEPLRKKLAKLSTEELQAMIPRGDMNASDWHNPRRLVRRIEIAQAKPSSISEPVPYDSLVIGLTTDMPRLYKRIDQRLQARMDAGMQKEIDMLLAGYDAHLPSMGVIGLNEHAYARRQMTWFKKQKNIHWFDIMEKDLETNVTTKVTDWYEN